MNPFSKPIKFTSKKQNHFYVIKNEKNEFLKIEDPEINQEVYEIPSISGGEEKPRLILEIPIPLCQKHFDFHNGEKFGVTICNVWDYIAIPTPLGSTVCRECKNELFIPSPYLSYADLRYANLSSVNLRSADLSYADLRSADLRYAKNINHSINLEEAYWNKFTQIDAEFKKLLN